MSDILVEREEAIATVIINRPRMRNAKAFESQDYKEGTRAFLEKRRPRFQGR